MNKHFLFGVLLSCAIVAGIPAQAEERLLASNGDLKAYVEKGACAEEMAVTVKSPDVSTFNEDSVPLQQLMAGVKAIIGLECGAAKNFSVTGQVNSDTVFKGRLEEATGRLVALDLPQDANQSAAEGPPTATPRDLSENGEVSPSGTGFSYIGTDGKKTTAVLVDDRLPLGSARCLGLPDAKSKLCESQWRLAANAASNKIAIRLFGDSLPEAVDPAYDRNESVSTLLNDIPPSTRLEIGAAAFGPLDETQTETLSIPYYGTAPIGKQPPLAEMMQKLTPFQMRRFWGAVRENAIANVDSQPAFPLGVRMYCAIKLQTYDFTKKVFPLAHTSQACSQAPLFNTDLIRHSLNKSIRLSSKLPPMPASLPKPDGEAETFWEQYKGEQLVLSFDVDIAGIDAERFNPKQLFAVIVDRGNKALFLATDLNTPIHIFEEPKDAPAPASNTASSAGIKPLPEGAIHLRNTKYGLLDNYYTDDLSRPQSTAGYFEPSESSQAKGLPVTVVSKTAHYIQTGQQGQLPKSAPVFHSGGQGFQTKIASMMGVPVDHVVRAQAGSSAMVYYVLPAPVSSYTIDIPEKLDMQGKPSVSVAGQLVRAVTLAIDEKREAQVLFFVPETLYIMDSDPTANRPDVPLHSIAASQEKRDLQIVNYPPAAWFTAEFARLRGEDPAATLQQVMNDYSYKWQIGDNFKQIEVVQELFAEQDAFDKARNKNEGVWVFGTASLQDYDPSTGFIVKSISLKPLDDGVKKTAPYKNLALEPGLAGKLAIKMPLEEAQAWKKQAPSFPSFAIRGRAKITGAEKGAGVRKTLKIELLELELLDRQADSTVRDPSQVRHTFDLSHLEDTTMADGGAKKEQNPRREAIRDADIIGLKLGMTVNQADATIRTKMDVGWIAELSETAKKKSTYKKDDPYNNYLLYISKDGKHQITLYVHPEQSNKLLGITRAISISPETEQDKMYAQLKTKYGNDPVLSDQYLLWTVDPGLKTGTGASAQQLGQGFRSGYCFTQLGSGISFQDLQTTDGKPLRDAVSESTEHGAMNKWIRPARISVYGSKVQDRSTATHSWDAEKWRQCGPTIMAKVAARGGNTKTLQVGLHDLNVYADLYLARQKQKKDAVVLPDL